MIKIDRYTTGAYPFPSRDRDPKSKDGEYCRQNAEAIYSLYLNGKTAWGYGRFSHFDTLRRYSTGQQDVEQYKTYLLNTTSENDDDGVYTSYDDLPVSRLAKRMGWYNIMWENLSPAPRIMSALLGKMEDVDYDVYVDMVDSKSQGLAEHEKYKKFHEARDIKWQNEFKTKAGIPIDEPINFPATPEELESFSAKEGFKLNIAKSMQKLLRHSFNISKWDDVVARKIRDDLLVIGYGATRDYYDDEDCQFKLKWIDPARTVIQHSHEFDYNDAEYAGYFSLWTVSNLRRKLPDVSEKELAALAMQYKGEFGNPDFVWGDYKSALNPNGFGYAYDDFKVWVFEAEWADTNTYKKLHYNSKYGRKSIIDLDYDSKVKPLKEGAKAQGASQEVKNTIIRQTYHCHWIVGTDHVFDYGPVLMAPRPKMNKPKLTFHVEQLLQPPIMSQMKTILDQIAITWLRHQNSIAHMVERGYAINIHMLRNITLGGKTLDPSQVLAMWKQSGIVPYQYSFQGPYAGGAASPITPIEGGLGTRVQETAQQLDILFNLIEKITGLNPVALGGSPSGETTLGETQMSVQAMTDTLRPLIGAFFDIKRSIGESILNRLQIGIRVSKKLRDIYAGVTSPSDIDNIRMSEQWTPKYGMELKAKPDLQVKQTLMQFIQVSLTNGRNGQPGLNVPQALDFTMRIERGEDLEQIRQDIDYAVQKAEEKAHAETMEKIDRQNQGLAAIEQQKSQNELQKIYADGQIDMEEEKIRGREKRLLEQLKNNQELYNKLYDDMQIESGLRTAKTE